MPQIIIADNAKAFTSKAFIEFLKKFNVQIRYNSFYHPQHNFVERSNKTIGNFLRCFCNDNHRHWDAHIPELQHALRTATNEVTGYTPYFLVFGREIVTQPSDYEIAAENFSSADSYSTSHMSMLEDRTNHFQEALKRIKINHTKNKTRYDKDRTTTSFEVGDLVLKRVFGLSDASKHVSAKLLPRFEQCLIFAKRSDLSYDLVDMDGKYVGNYHVKDIYEL